MNEFGSLPGRLTGPVRAGLVCVPAFCAAVWLGLLLYPPDVAGLVLLPSLAMFVLSLMRPTVAICAIVFLFPLLPLLPTNLGIANVSLLGHMLLAMAAGRAVAGIRSKEPIRLPRSPIDAPLMVFLACIWISCLTVPSRYTLPWNRVFVADFLEILPRIFFYREGDLFLSLSAAVLFSLSAFFFWQLWQRLGQIGVRRILTLLLAGAAVSILFAFYQRTTGAFIPDYWVREGQASRVNGLFPDPNSFGTHIVSLLFLFALCPGKTNRILFRIAVPFLFVTLIFTGSRAAWASFLLVVCGLGTTRVYRFLTSGERTADSRKVRRVLLVAVIILLLFAYVGYECALRADATQEGGSYLGRILTLFNRSDTFNHILKGRPTMWYAALNMMREFPVAGVGVGLYREVMPHFLEAGQTYWWERKKENAHNYFLQVGGELGFIGLVAFVWLCVTVLAVYPEARKRGVASPVQRSAFWALVAFLLTTLGAHPLIQIEIQILFWILVVLLCSGLNDTHQAHTKTQRREGYSRAPASTVFGGGIVLFSLVASLRQAGNLFPYQLYDLGVNTWENMGRPGAWTAQREWFRWTKGTAVLLFRPEEPRLAMRIKLGRPGVAPGQSVEIRTRLGDKPERRFDLAGEGEEEIVLDFVGLEGNVVPLGIRSSSVWRGLRARGQRDWRTLGVRVYPAFPRTYAPGYSEGLGTDETREGLSVRLFKDNQAFLWESVDGRTLTLPFWIEEPREKGNVEVYLDLEPVATLRLERRGWQPLQFLVREPMGDGVAVTLRTEDAGPGAVGVGRVSWLP